MTKTDAVLNVVNSDTLLFDLVAWDVKKVFFADRESNAQQGSGGQSAPAGVAPYPISGTLTYDDINQLQSTQDYEYSKSAKEHKISFKNGPVFVGPSDTEGIFAYLGSGRWTDIPVRDLYIHIKDDTC